MSDFRQQSRKPVPSEECQMPRARATNANELTLLLRIEQLEGELQQKDRNQYNQLQEQLSMRERLQDLKAVLKRVSRRLTLAEHYFTDEYRQLLDQLSVLERENRSLKSCNEAWSERWIIQEFKLLTAQKELDTLKTAYAWVISLLRALSC
jgi:hypothetical protein